MSPELRQAFEETNYIVDHKPPFTLNIGQACPALNELLQEGGHEAAAFITAWNPFSQPLIGTLCGSTMDNHFGFPRPGTLHHITHDDDARAFQAFTRHGACQLT